MGTHVSVFLVDRNSAVVTRHVGLLAFLFLGRDNSERYVVRLPSIQGGFVWIYEYTQRPVENEVEKLLERAAFEAELAHDGHVFHAREARSRL